MKNAKSQNHISNSGNRLSWFSGMVITASIIFTPSLNASSTDYLVPKGSHSVHIRTSPNGRVIGALNPGSKVAVVSGSHHRGWAKVKYQGRTAWIFRSLVTTPRQHTSHSHSPKIAALVELKTASATALIPPRRPTTPVSSTSPNSSPAPQVTHSQSEPDSKTAAGYCETCAQQAQNPIAKVGEIATDVASAAGKAVTGAGNAVVGAGEKIKSWFSNAWSSAVKPRQMARFCGGGVRSGNLSKCMCAQAAKEALISSGICNGPMPGNAIDLHRDGVILNQCPSLKLDENITDPRLAPVPSLTIYSGYAGKRRHSYGHVEAKIMRNGKIWYCSDFCREHPTLSVHNQVAGIYILK